MPLIYNKLFDLMKARGVTKYQLRKEKVIGVAAMEKLRKNEGYVDTRTIEYLCEYLNCQPGDIMEYIPEEKGDERQ